MLIKILNQKTTMSKTIPDTLPIANIIKDKTNNMNGSYIISIHDNQLEDKHIKRAKEDTCLTLCAVLWLMIILCPFIICDLYFGFNHQPCLNVKFNDLDINLKAWLLTNGFLAIVYIVYLFIVAFQEESIRNCMSIAGQILVSGFSVIWTIVGAVLFWKYIEPNHLCDKSLTTYLWVRLIMGLIGAGSCLFSNKNED